MKMVCKWLKGSIYTYMEKFEMCGLGFKFLWCGKKKEQRAAADPTHYQTFFLEVKWEDGLPSIGVPGLLWEWCPWAFPSPSHCTSLPWRSPYTEPCLRFQRKRKGMGRRIKRKLFFLISFQTCCRTKPGWCLAGGTLMPQAVQGLSWQVLCLFSLAEACTKV